MPCRYALEMFTTALKVNNLFNLLNSVIITLWEFAVNIVFKTCLT